MVIVPAQELFAFGELFLGKLLASAEHDRGGGFYLVIIELTEVLGVHLALDSVDDGGLADDCKLRRAVLNGEHDVREFADSGGLDDDAVGVELLRYLLESAAKIADEAAADAAAVHLGYLNSGLAQKAAVDADLSKLVLDQDDLFALPCLSQQLFDKRCLTGAEKTGEYCNLSHLSLPLLLFILKVYYSTLVKRSKSFSYIKVFFML